MGSWSQLPGAGSLSEWSSWHNNEQGGLSHRILDFFPIDGRVGLSERIFEFAGRFGTRVVGFRKAIVSGELVFLDPLARGELNAISREPAWIITAGLSLGNLVGLEEEIFMLQRPSHHRQASTTSA